MLANLIRILVVVVCLLATVHTAKAIGIGSTWASTISVRASWTFDPGGSTVDFAPGEATAAAVQIDSLPPQVDPPPCRTTLQPIGVVAFPVGDDAADMVLRGVAADAVAVQDLIESHASASIMRGFAQSNALLKIVSADFYLPVSYPTDRTCVLVNSENDLFLSGATAGTVVTWHLIPPASGGTGPTLLPKVSVVWTASCTRTILFEPARCQCISDELPVPACPGPVITIQLLNRVYVRNSAGIITVLPVNGVFAARPSGFTRLGFMSDTAFNPVPDGNGGFSVSATDFPINVTLPADAVEVGYTTVSDTFARHNGDLTPGGNPQGKLTWNDRRAFIQLLGATLNSNQYTARADFDLDGDIDESDYSAFLSLFNSNACLGDFNANGTLETADLFAFINAWFTVGRIADFNNVNGVTAQDLFDFIAAWSSGTGC